MPDELLNANSSESTDSGALENAQPQPVSRTSGVEAEIQSAELPPVPTRPDDNGVPDAADAPEHDSEPALSVSTQTTAGVDIPHNVDLPPVPVTPEDTALVEREPSTPDQPAGQLPAVHDPDVDSIEIIRTPTDQEGGIEILIRMAEKGEIDPKNIDIIDVTDRFLRAIAAAPKENLRQSGKIIFQASVLLRMKAEALLAARIEDDMGFSDDFMDYDADGVPLIFDSNREAVARQITLQDLERALVRQTKGRQLRHRRVTLEQLIEALRDADRLEKNRSERKVKPTIAVDGYADMRDMDDILDLAGGEDIEDTITRIETLLSEMLETDNLLSLESIVETMKGRAHWVDVFLAVLFLENAGKIFLQQEHFYGPLSIQRSDITPQPQAPTPIIAIPMESGLDEAPAEVML